MIYVFRKPSEMISCRQSEAVTSRFVCGVRWATERQGRPEPEESRAYPVTCSSRRVLIYFRCARCGK